MTHSRSIKVRVYTRAVVAIVLISSWILLSLTGLLLWLAPTGRRAGQIELLFGLTKHEWGDIHLWFAAATILVTLSHVIIDWKALRGVIRYLASAHREQRASLE